MKFYFRRGQRVANAALIDVMLNFLRNGVGGRWCIFHPYPLFLRLSYSCIYYIYSIYIYKIYRRIALF